MKMTINVSRTNFLIIVVFTIAVISSLMLIDFNSDIAFNILSFPDMFKPPQTGYDYDYGVAYLYALEFYLIIGIVIAVIRIIQYKKSKINCD